MIILEHLIKIEGNSLKQVFKKIENLIFSLIILIGMSMSTFNLNDIKYFTNGNHTLMVGSIETNTPVPHSITIEPTVKTVSHVVLDKHTLGYFRTLMSSAPVSGNAIYAYDQMGSIVSRYEAGRKNNTSGTLGISVEPVTLLSNISLPAVEEGSHLFLPLTSYTGLYSIVSNEYRRELIHRDLDMFREKSNLSNVTLVISKTLHNDIKAVLPEYDDYFAPLFRSVVVTEDSSVIAQIVELICGKVISGHKASFQGFMNFGADYEVIHSTVCPAESKTEELGRVLLTNRRGGRLQINVDGQRGLASFILILRRTSTTESLPSFMEETTTTAFTVTPDMAVDSSTFPGLSMLYLKDFLETIHFQEELQSKAEPKQLAYIQENPTKVIRYLFTNPHLSLDDYKSLTGMSRAIFSDFTHLMSSLRSTIEHKMESGRSAHPSWHVHRGLERQRALGGDNFLHVASSVPVEAPYLGRTPSGVN